MTTDWNHNKLQQLPYSSRPMLLNPWQLEHHSRPRSLSLGCHPDSEEFREVSSKRGLTASSLNISLGSLNAGSKKKKETSSNRCYLKICIFGLLAIIISSMTLYLYLNGVTLNFQTFFLSSVDDVPEDVTSADRQGESYLVNDEKPVENLEVLGEYNDEKILERQLRDASHKLRVYESVVQEDSFRNPLEELNVLHHSVQPSTRPGLQTSLRQGYTHGQQHSINSHSYVYHRHHNYPQHTGSFYAQHFNSHPHLNMHHPMHPAADNHLRALHNYHRALARQSWLVDHMKHQTGSRPSAPYTWEAPHQHTKQLKHVYGNQVTYVKKGDAKAVVTVEENNTQPAKLTR